MFPRRGGAPCSECDYHHTGGQGTAHPIHQLSLWWQPPRCGNCRQVGQE